MTALFVDLGFHAISQSSETFRYDTVEVQSNIGLMASCMVFLIRISNIVNGDGY